MTQTEHDKPMIAIWGYPIARWTLASYMLLAAHGILIAATFLDYGLTTDEPPLLNYGKDILLWYRSGFVC
ncbi:MAG: hypothetical protein O3B73_03095 [bacterium]|nr:hypothetical protein [bacterium]